MSSLQSRLKYSALFKDSDSPRSSFSRSNPGSTVGMSPSSFLRRKRTEDTRILVSEPDEYLEDRNAPPADHCSSKGFSSNAVTKELIEDLVKKALGNSKTEIMTIASPPPSCLSESRSTKSNVVQILSVLAISLGHFLDGTVLAFTSPLLPDLLREDSPLPITHEQATFIASIHAVGASVGCLLAGLAMRNFGRRGSVVFINIPVYFAGYVLLGFAQKPLALYFGRFLCGFGIGFTLSVPTVYIVEITSPEIRGVLGVLPNLFCQLGILYTYIAGYYADWRWIAYSMTIFCLPTVFFVWFIPESPVYLTAKGLDAQAEETLKTLNLDSSHLALKTLRDRVMSEKTGMEILREFRSGSVLKPFLSNFGLMFFFQASAYPILISYTVRIFQESDVKIGEELASIVIGVVVVLASLISIPLAKIFPRKWLLLTSGIGVTLTLTSLGSIFYLRETKLSHHIPALPIIVFVIYIFLFMCGYGSVSWLLMAEILPSSVRSSTYSFCVGGNWIWNFGFAHSFLYLLKYLGASGTFWTYSGLSGIGIIYVAFALPETRNKSPLELVRFYEGENPQKEEKKCADKGIA